MNNDAFSSLHPAVNFVFFLGAICFGVTIQHPAYIAAGFLGAVSYYLLLHGKKGLKTVFGLLPVFVILTAVNPLFNNQGERVLFHIFGRPYTFEALLYGMAIASLLVSMLMWFGCYNAVMTSDKFTCLFGNIIPSLSLLFVMVLRMVPNLIRKASQISGARKSVGKGAGEQSTKKEKLNDGMNVLSALTSWALESSVMTADSMRSRGYGTAKTSSFNIYHMTASDFIVFAVMLITAGAVIFASTLGGTKAVFTPEFYIAPLTGINAAGFSAYCVFLLIPTALHIKEDIQWHILRSKI